MEKVICGFCLIYNDSSIIKNSCILRKMESDLFRMLILSTAHNKLKSLSHKTRKASFLNI